MITFEEWLEYHDSPEHQADRIEFQAVAEPLMTLVVEAKRLQAVGRLEESVQVAQEVGNILETLDRETLVRLALDGLATIAQTHLTLHGVEPAGGWPE